MRSNAKSWHQLALWILSLSVVAIVAVRVFVFLAVREMLARFEKESGLELPTARKLLHSEWTWMQSNHIRAVLSVDSDGQMQNFTNRMAIVNQEMRMKLGPGQFEYVSNRNRNSMMRERGLFWNLPYKPSDKCAQCAEIGIGEEQPANRWAVAADGNTIWIWFSVGQL